MYTLGSFVAGLSPAAARILDACVQRAEMEITPVVTALGTEEDVRHEMRNGGLMYAALRELAERIAAIEASRRRGADGTQSDVALAAAPKLREWWIDPNFGEIADQDAISQGLHERFVRVREVPHGG